MYQHLKILLSSVKQYFPNNQCTVSQNHTWKKDEFKMQNRPVEFNAKQYKRFTDTFSDSTLQLTFKKLLGGSGQDGGRVRRGDHLPSHRYIRNTSTRGTAPTEHPLNAGRRCQTSQKARNSPRTWVGQKKRQRQKNRDGTCTSGREL